MRHGSELNASGTALTGGPPKGLNVVDAFELIGELTGDGWLVNRIRGSDDQSVGHRLDA